MKEKRQRAIITLTDNDEGGFKAQLVYEPSVLKRTTNSPAINAAVRLQMIITKNKDVLGLPLIKEKKIEIAYS